MLKIAAKNLLHEPVRLIVTLVGVMFSVILMLVQTGFYIGFFKNTAQIIDITEGDVWVAAPNTINFDSAKAIPISKYYKVKEIEGVLWARKLVNTWGLLKLENGSSQSVQLIGIDPETGTGGPREMAEGSVADLRMPNTIIMDESSLSRLGNPPVGSRFEILGRKAKLAGICRGIRSFTTYPIAFTSLSTVRDYSALYRSGEITFVVCKVRDGYDPAEVAERMRWIGGVDVYTSREFSRKVSMYWMTSTGMGIAIGIMVLLGFVVGLVIVAQTIYSSTMEHLREFGTLKALGATNFEVSRIVIVQAVSLGMIGYLIGMAVVMYLRPNLFEKINVTVLLPPEAYVVMGLVAMAMCLTASILSIRRIYRVDPVTVFRA